MLVQQAGTQVLLAVQGYTSHWDAAKLTIWQNKSNEDKWVWLILLYNHYSINNKNDHKKFDTDALANFKNCKKWEHFTNIGAVKWCTLWRTSSRCRRKYEGGASGRGRSLHNILFQCEAVVELQQKINPYKKGYIMLFPNIKTPEGMEGFNLVAYSLFFAHANLGEETLYDGFHKVSNKWKLQSK